MADERRGVNIPPKCDILKVNAIMEGRTTMKASGGAKDKFKFFRVLILVAVALLAVAAAALFIFQAEDMVQARGKVEGFEEYLFRSPRDGEIGKLLKNEGDLVRKGEAVLTMDDAEVRDKLSLLESQAAELRAELEVKKGELASLRLEPLAEEYRHADIELKRAIDNYRRSDQKLRSYRELSAKSAISRMELDQVELEHISYAAALEKSRRVAKVVSSGLGSQVIRNADSAVRLLEVKLVGKAKEAEMLRHHLADYVVAAPEDCVVLELPVKPGCYAPKGELIVRMASVSRKKLVTLVQESQIYKVSPGQEARIISNSYNPYDFGYFGGKVLEISEVPEKRGDLNYYTVKIVITQEPYELKLGSTADAMIIAGKERIFTSLIGWKR